MSLGLLILAGGQSRRMKVDKADLPWDEGTLLTRWLDEAGSLPFKEIIISSNKVRHLPEKQDIGMPIRQMEDTYPNKGPLGGIVTALEKGLCDAYLVVAVDMPFFSCKAAYRWWLVYTHTQLSKDEGKRVNRCNGECGLLGKEGIYWSYTGQVPQPMGGIYTKKALPMLKEALCKGEYRLRDLPHQRLNSFLPEEEVYGDLLFMNVNQPKEYKLALAINENAKRQVPLVSITASRSKTGKTRVIRELIHLLSKKGFRVGFVKSDGHGFQMDRSDSDTGKATIAGASAIAIAGPGQYAIVERKEKVPSLLELSQRLEVDLVMLETRTQGVSPVFEVCRKAYTQERLYTDEETMGVIGDTSFSLPQDEGNYYSWDELVTLADWIIDFLMKVNVWKDKLSQ